MAIIIDANMPTNGCADCPLKRYWEGNPWTYGYACFITSQDIDKEIKEGVFHEFCPIIGEIPDSHGRLIVADALLEKLEKIALPDDLTYTIAHGIMRQIVENAETIVEANNVNDNQR